MAKYEIKKFVSMDYTFCLIQDAETGDFFGGYDDMGSVNWTNSLCAYEMDEQEALQIKADLEAADADDQPQETYRQSPVKTEIKTETILKHLQARWTNALEEGKKFGPEDRVYQRKVEWCIGMKELVEELLETPVNLQLDGLVTTGF